MTTECKDVYSRITDKIVADMEKGQLTWQKPWIGGNSDSMITRPLRMCGKAYQGINILMLWASAAARGYSNPVWMTFKQALEIGANVRKGEKGTLVVYANTITRTEQNDTGGDIERTIPFMKGYTVFNIEQIENLPTHYTATPAPVEPINQEQRIDRLERFVAGTGATLRHGGDSAFFSPHHDFVQMPDFQAFRDAASYYAVLSHELIHWTGHKSRLDREFGRRFADERYAREELVAELGSAFLCADLGISPETRPDHAAYIQDWIKVLKNDKRFIFSAAAAASRAADLLTGLQQPATETQAA